MEENTQDVTPAPDSATPPAGAQGEKQAFVPFFNEEYRFQSGLGDVSIAYRLGAIFILMLIAAALMYLGAWWWVGTHPLAQHH
jgi:peptidoglycan biosynthesis protein MviN/MurJ (putative lipid II flippase)